jgi:hypothetical protein
MKPNILKGYEAYNYATKHGLPLIKAADPISGRSEVSLQEAQDILQEDPSLLSITLESDGDYSLRLLERLTSEQGILLAGARGVSLDSLGTLLGLPRQAC